jgi:AcrR family transcriptional regulator
MMRTATRNRPPAAKPYHHGKLRESLLDVADRLLSKRGAESLTLRAVAKSAGVSHAAPYHHFRGLDDLLAAVAERAFASLAGDMQPAAALPQARERLLAICAAYVDFARRKPAQFRLMFGPLLARKRQFPGLLAAADRTFQILLSAASAYDPAQGPLLALSGWSLAHGLANLNIDGAFDGLPIPVPDPSLLARQMSNYLLAGAAAPSPAPGFTGGAKHS